MGVVIIDGTTVRDFMSNEEQFRKSAEQFETLDLNNDGVLSRGELQKAFKSMRLIETHFDIDVATLPEELSQLYNSIFEKFNVDGSDTVDKAEFKAKINKILLAITDSLGSFPM